jgi:hypothetical protein
MGLTTEHVGPKILAKTKIYALTRAELLFNLCYEIPCIINVKESSATRGCTELYAEELLNASPYVILARTYKYLFCY